jgi:hypothetical protein
MQGKSNNKKLEMERGKKSGWTRQPIYLLVHDNPCVPAACHISGPPSARESKADARQNKLYLLRIQPGSPHAVWFNSRKASHLVLSFKV